MIFSSGNVRIIDLIKVGFGMKIIGIAIILFSSMVLLSPTFHLQQITTIFNGTVPLNGTGF